MRLFLLLVAIMLFVAGCSTREVSKPKPKTPYYLQEANNSWITNAITQEYKKWSATPYQYGGTTLNGVDCSSLVQSIYRDAFHIQIPRTTKNQAKIGYKIDKKSSREGDLVFFKTGYKARHSGVIIRKDKFVHSSATYGVTVSSLNNPYWKDKYWQTRRVLP